MKRTTGIAVLTTMLVALACTGLVAYHEHHSAALIAEAREMHQAIAVHAAAGVASDLQRREIALVVLLHELALEPAEAPEHLRIFRVPALHAIGAALYRGDGSLVASDGSIKVDAAEALRASDQAPIAYLAPRATGEPLLLAVRRESPDGGAMMLVASYDLKELLSDGVGEEIVRQFPNTPVIRFFDPAGTLLVGSAGHDQNLITAAFGRPGTRERPDDAVIGGVAQVSRGSLRLTVTVTSPARVIASALRRDLAVTAGCVLLLLTALAVPLYLQRRSELEAVRARIEAREWESAFDRQKFQAESHREAASVIEAAHDAIWVVSLTGSVEYINPAAATLFGGAPQSMGEVIARMLEADGQRAERVFVAAQSGSSGSFEMHVNSPEGQWHVADVNVVPIARAGEPDRVVFSARDVTDERLHASHARDSQSRFRRLLDGASTSAVFLDIEGKVEFANTFFLQMTGYEPHEVIGQQWINFIAPETKADYTADYLARIRTGEVASGAEYEVVTRTGEHRTISWKRVVLRNVAGDVTGVGSIGDDLTAIRTAEDSLRRVRDFYGRILDTIVSGVFVTDAHDLVTYANVSVRERSGLPLLEDTSFRSREDVPQACIPLYDVYAATRASLQPESFSNLAIHLPAGGARLHTGWMIPLVDGGVFQGMICTTEDVTERASTKAALEQSLIDYGTLVNSVPGIVWKADALTLQIHYVSPEAEHILGYPVFDWYTARFWHDHIHPDDREWAANFCAAETKEARGHTFEYRMIAADGRTVWLRDVVSVTGEPGHPIMLFGVIVDVTDRKLAEEALKASEARFRAIYEQSELGIVLYGRDGARESNAAFKKMLGLPEARRLSPNGLLDQHASLEQQRLRVWSGGREAEETELVLRRATGEPVTVRSVASIVRDALGEPLMVVAVVEDITFRKDAQREVAESREKFRKLVELSSDCIWRTDKESRFTYISPHVYDVIGYRPEEVLGQRVPDLLVPEDQVRFEEVAVALHASRQSFSLIEVSCRSRDGRRVLLETSGTPLFGDDGQVAGYDGVARDITEREESRAERQRLATAIESAAEAIVITGLDGKIEYVNPAFEAITGYTREEAVGNNPRILKSGRQTAELYEGLWETIRRDRLWVGHFVNRRKDGTLYEADATIAPIHSDRGVVSGYVAVQRDVTEHMALLTRLQQAQEFERLGRIVGGVAHEVRNPLNAIRVASAALELDFGDDPDAKPLFDVVTAQVGRLARLMHELLELGKPLDAARLEVRSAGELIAETLQLWRGSHPEQAPDRVTSEVLLDVPAVRVDTGRMQQVLLNLLDNALQHSASHDPITIGASVDNDSVRLWVRDSGSGLAPEQSARLFEPFFTTRRGGTGLGLSLVKNIVQQHGGQVVLHNNVDARGCVAEVFLPALLAREVADVVA